MFSCFLGVILIAGSSADFASYIQQPGDSGEPANGTDAYLFTENHEMVDTTLHRQLRSVYSGYSRSNNGNSGRNPIIEMIIGCVLWCCILPCTMWLNERIAVKQSKLQGKALSNAIEVEDVNRQPLEELNGHIVYIGGNSQCKQTLTDQAFPSVQATNCVKLRRIVEMYQWVQHESDNRVSFKMEWKDSQSSCPKGGPTHQNPQMPMPSTKRAAESYRMHVNIGNGDPCAEAAHGSVRLGAYYLGEYIIREMENWVEQPVDPQAFFRSIPPQLARFGPPRQVGQWWQFGSGNQVEIGDIRVRFEVLQCGPISLCGVLARVGNGWTLVPILREEGNQGESCVREFGCSCGRPDHPVFSGNPADDYELIEWLEEHDSELTGIEQTGLLQGKSAHGRHSVYAPASSGPYAKMMNWVGLEEEFLAVVEREVDFDDLLEAEATHSAMKHCGCRICNVCVGMCAASCIIAPLTFLLNFNWLVGMMGGFALSCLISGIACAVSLIISFIIIGVAWLAARPRLTCTLLLLAVLITVPVVWFFFWAHNHEERERYINSDGGR